MSPDAELFALLMLALGVFSGFNLGRHFEARRTAEALRFDRRHRARQVRALHRACNQALDLAIAREQELLGVIRQQRAYITEFAVSPRVVATEEEAQEIRELWAAAWRAAHEGGEPQGMGAES